jgi:hypothetical protein
MTSAFNMAMAAAVKSIRDEAGVAGVYHQGEIAIPLKASERPKDYESTDVSGLTVTDHCHDWEIVAADLAVDGTRLKPQRGDTIVETSNGVATTHKVMMLPGRNAYDTTRGGLAVIVHTKVVGETEETP